MSKTNIIGDVISASTVMNSAGLFYFGQEPEEVSGAGVASVTHTITHLIATGAGDAVSLADGREGQVKILLTKNVVGGGSTVVITPANLRGWSTITFDHNGDTCFLVFTGGKWNIVGTRGAAIA